jgi:hypothetical protein
MTEVLPSKMRIKGSPLSKGASGQRHASRKDGPIFGSLRASLPRGRGTVGNVRESRSASTPIDGRAFRSAELGNFVVEHSLVNGVIMAAPRVFYESWSLNDY